MGIFGKFKRTGKKEFMKYEDGKIIPIKVEEHKNYKEYNISSVEREELDIRTVIKERVDMPGKVKRYGTLKTLKIGIAILIAVFFTYTMKDVYVAFTEPGNNQTTENPPTEEPSDTGSLGQGDDGIDKLPPVSPNDETDKPEQDKDKDKDKSSLKTSLDVSNVVNSMLSSEISKEVGSLNQYLDNKLNKYSFEKRLKSSIETKKQLSTYLNENKALFEKEDILSFYKTIDHRLINSAQLSQFLLDSFGNSTTNEELLKTTNGFIEKDISLKEKQNKEFIQILKLKKIEYTIDELNEEIIYTIN